MSFNVARLPHSVLAGLLICPTHVWKMSTPTTAVFRQLARAYESVELLVAFVVNDVRENVDDLLAIAVEVDAIALFVSYALCTIECGFLPRQKGLRESCPRQQRSGGGSPKRELVAAGSPIRQRLDDLPTRQT